MTTGHHGRAARPLPGPRARSWAPAPRGPGGRGWRPCTGSLTKARLAPRHRNPRKAAVPGTAKHPAAAWRVGPLAPGGGDARSPWARICPPAPCSAAAPAPRAPGPGDTAPQGGGPSTGGAGGGCRSRACRLTRPRPGAAGRMASWRWPTGDSDGTAGVTARGWVRPETQCVLQTGARAGTRAAGRVAPGACEWLSPHPPRDGVCPGHTRPKSRQATPGSPGTDPRPEDTQWRWPRRMARWRCAAQAACRRTLSSPGGCPQRQGTQHFGGQCLGHKTSERLWRPASPEGKVPAQRQMRAF